MIDPLKTPKRTNRPHFPAWRLVAATAIGAMAIHGFAATTGQLPAWVCQHPDAVFVDGFAGTPAIVHQPSNGSGGNYPGNLTITFFASGLGFLTYYAHVPSNYSPSHPMPLMFALHGAGGPNTGDFAAQTVRNDWSATADSGGFIVVAPIGSDGPNGSWSVPPKAGTTDYDVFVAILANVQSRYNIDLSRRIGWGYSAGGHVMHDLILGAYSANVNINTFAAYSVNAGVLAGLACQGLSGAQCTALVAGANRKIPLDIHIGTGDSQLYPYAVDDQSRFLVNGWTSNSTLYFTTFNGGHIYTQQNLAEIWTNLCPFQLLP
ncbi:MAG: hypothetical protein ABI451_05610 [Dokdonella sp.]